MRVRRRRNWRLLVGWCGVVCREAAVFRVAAIVGAVLLGGVNRGLAQPVRFEGPSLPEGDPLTWVASMNVTGPRIVTLKVALPESGELVELLEVVGEAAHVERYHRGRGHWEVHVKGGDSTTLNLTLKGPADEFRNSAAVEYAWYEPGAPSRRTLLNGPIERSKSYPVRFAFGVPNEEDRE